MGLGTPATVPLADAREKAASARRTIAQGLNPIDERKRTSGVPTFGEMADQVRETLSAGFRNERHKAQWKSTLATHAAPLSNKPVRYRHHRRRAGDFEADLDDQARNRLAGPGPDRKGVGRCQCQGVP